jgi:arginine N-succinyltransferase
LLPQPIRDGLGQVHVETEPAVAMLVAEGFQFTDMIDIFDAGPVLRCQTDKVDAVRRTRQCKIDRVESELEPSSDAVILASDRDGFTSLMTTAMSTDPGLVISCQAASTLGVDVGDECQVMPLRPPS